MRGFQVLFLALLACNGEASGGNPPSSPAPAASAAPAGLPAAPGSSEVVARFNGGTITYGDVSARVGNDLAKQQQEYLLARYEAELAAAEGVLDEKLLEAEAKKRKLADVKALLAAEVEAKAKAPVEDEIQAVYAANARRINKPIEEARPEIERYLRDMKQAERRAAFLQELRTAYEGKVEMPFPDVPRIAVSVDDDPSVGPADAPITIVQFAEYQCPYCGKAREAVDQVMKNYEGKVRFVFRDFPLNFHDRAIPAAVAANCAGKQDPAKYWKVHDTLMANQRALSEPDLERAAVDAGVDLAKWKSCRTQVSMEEEVKKDLEDGQTAGVTGTPAFFINGVFLSGALPYEKFKVIIDHDLAKKKG